MGTGPLYDEGTRTDYGRKRYDESVFDFVNRAADEVWERVRVEEEAWYTALPDAAKAQVRGRFRSKGDDAHFGAWWELYLHRLFSRLGFEVDVEPTIAGRDDHLDLVVVRNDERVLVEAVSFSSGIVEEGRNERLEEQVHDTVRGIVSDSSGLFYVFVEFDDVGEQMLSKRFVTREVVAWLDSLAPAVDKIHANSDFEDGGLPVLRLRRDRWVVKLTAMPVGPEMRGHGDHSLWAGGSTLVGNPNDGDRLTKALERKRKKYGTPDHPFLIAALAVTPTWGETVKDALCGTQERRTQEGVVGQTPNGFFLGPDGPRAPHVSGVLVGDGLGFHSIAQALPRLWHNPTADRPVRPDFLVALPSVHVVDGHLDSLDGDASPHMLLGIPADWPGSW